MRAGLGEGREIASANGDGFAGTEPTHGETTVAAAWRFDVLDLSGGAEGVR
jgi:hypothetical protein